MCIECPDKSHWEPVQSVLLISSFFSVFAAPSECSSKEEESRLKVREITFNKVVDAVVQLPPPCD